MGYKRRRPRATCSTCGKTLLLRADGKFRIHVGTKTTPKDDYGLCMGSLLPPAEPFSDHEVAGAAERWRAQTPGEVVADLKRGIEITRGMV